MIGNPALSRPEQRPSDSIPTTDNREINPRPYGQRTKRQEAS
ncbi:hypothetical protein OROGR_024668 [Orobanche gracilis]